MASNTTWIAHELALELISRDWQPKALSASKASNPQILLQQCLEESIALREAGYPELSFALLQSADRAGLHSPWIQDNKARALVALGRRQEACGLWNELLTNPEAAVAETAQAMIQLQQDSLINTLGCICAYHGWNPRYISQIGEKSLMECVLHEIILARESGHSELSLLLATETLGQGWDDPWLIDNKARALVHLAREDEALALWLSLRQHANPEIAATASEMVEYYSTKAEYRHLQRRCEQLIAQGDKDSAVNELVESLSNNPGSDEIRNQLITLLRPEGTDLVDKETAAADASLLIHERLVNTFEQYVEQNQAAG